MAVALVKPMMTPKTIDHAAAFGLLTGIIGSVTFADIYQVMSFLVMALSAIHLTLKIRNLSKNKEDD